MFYDKKESQSLFPSQENSFPWFWSVSSCSRKHLNLDMSVFFSETGCFSGEIGKNRKLSVSSVCNFNLFMAELSNNWDISVPELTLHKQTICRAALQWTLVALTEIFVLKARGIINKSSLTKFKSIAFCTAIHEPSGDLFFNAEQRKSH